MNHYAYSRAESFLPWNLTDTVLNSTIFPHWPCTKSLYYFQQNKTGNVLVHVDTITGEKEQIFDCSALLDALSSHLTDTDDSAKLSLDKLKIQENPLRIYFTHRNKYWCYNIEKSILIKEKTSSEYLKSPDDHWVLQKKNYNLFLTSLTDNAGFQLTSDGTSYYDYASSPETNTRAITQRLENSALPLIALWSPNSRKIVTHKLDQRSVPSLFLLQNAPEGSQRPTLHTYRMSFSGDEYIPRAELVVIDTLTKTVTPLNIDPLLSPYLTPLEYKWVWWSKDSKKIYFLHETRGSKELKLCSIDIETNIARILISESSDTYVEPSQNFLWSHQIIVIEDTQEVVWLSEHSGYSHLYLYTIDDGALKNCITQGEWNVRQVHFYDIKTKWLYFTATGFNKKIDPYYKQLFRCRLDGSELELLTKEKGNHSISISPYQNCFLDTYSEINSAPISVLKKMDGSIISHLESTDISGLIALNWIPPKRINVTARDGKTAIYGNIYFPSHFDSSKKYPLIDHVYPGPQLYRTPTHFNLYEALFRSAWTAQALAELGFIVIHIDGLGTPGRSKAFHHFTYQNIGDCGIPDHVSAIKQLAEKYNFIDLERVGITGYSGGGYAAARAMLMYPEFFKVGVACAGNHDLRCYPANYGEKYNGLDTSTYIEQSNITHAKKLRGKLLLIHGEMDDNVHPCATLQLVNALIEHNKDFDMLIMPNQNHKSTFDHPYYMRKQWDYFVRHLLDETPPENYQITPIYSEFPQVFDW